MAVLFLFPVLEQEDWLALVQELSGREGRMGSMSKESGKAPKINSADFRVLLKPGRRPSRLCQREQRLPGSLIPQGHLTASSSRLCRTFFFKQ